MVELTDIQGIGPATAEALGEEGINSVDDLAEADAQTVENAKNVTEQNAQMFIVRAQDMLGENDAEVDEEDLPEEDDVSDDPTEDLFPESPSADAEASQEDESEEEGEEVAEETTDAESDSASEEDSFDLSLEFNDRQYDLLMYTLVGEFIKQQRRNRERAEHADTLLSEFRPLDGGGTYENQVSRGELNTLYSAVTSTKRSVQGKNHIELMHEMLEIVEQVEEAREQLF